MNFQEAYWTYLMFIISLLGSVSNFVVGKIIWTKLGICTSSGINNTSSNDKHKHHGAVTVRSVTTTINREKGSPRHYFILSCLFVSDFMFCFLNSVAFLIKSILGYSPNFVCQYQGVTTVTFASAGVMMLALLAYDRYLTIVKQKNLERTKAIWLVVGSFSYSWLLGLVLLIQPPLKLNLSPSKLFCVPPWQDWEPIIVTHSIVSIVTLISSMILTGIYYFRVYQSVTLASRNVRASIPSFTTKQHRDNNIALRMAVLVLVFLVGWGCYGTLIITSLITNEPVSPLYDLISVFLAISESVFNPVVYYVMKYKWSNTRSESTANTNSSNIANNTNTANAAIQNNSSPRHLVRDYGSPKRQSANAGTTQQDAHLVVEMKRERWGNLEISPPPTPPLPSLDTLDELSSATHNRNASLDKPNYNYNFKENDNGSNNLKLPTNNFFQFDKLSTLSIDSGSRSFSGNGGIASTSTGNSSNGTSGSGSGSNDGNGGNNIDSPNFVPDASLSPPPSPQTPPYPMSQTVRLLPLSFSSFHHSNSRSQSREMIASSGPISIRISPAKFPLASMQTHTSAAAIGNNPTPLRQIVVSN